MSSQLLLPAQAAVNQTQPAPRASCAVHWHLPVLLLGGAAFLCANLYSWRLQPFLLSGDQVFLWTDAWRMLSGERPYQDFLQFTPPGADLVYLGLFQMFGPRIWVTNALVLALGVLLAALCYALARQITDRSGALLAGGLFLAVLYGKLLCATHHWFSTGAVLAATLILMQALTPYRLLAAGALLGLASFFTQTRGLAAGLAVVCYLLWEARQRRSSAMTLCRQVSLLAASFCVSLLALNASFIRHAGLGLLWELQVSYVQHDFVRSYKTSALDLALPHLLTVQNLPALAPYLAVYILAPLVCGIVLLRRVFTVRHRPATASLDPGSASDLVLLLALVGGALLAEVATDITWLRLYCVAAPGIILLIWLMGHTAQGSMPLGSPALQLSAINMRPAYPLDRAVKASVSPVSHWAPVLLWTVAVVLGLQQVWGRQSTQVELLQLPGGSAVMSADAAERFTWLAAHTTPGEPFLEATWPGAYLPLALQPPIYLDVFTATKMTRRDWVERSVRQLEQHPVHYIMLQPGILEGPDNLAPFVSFLRTRYQPIHTFANGDQVWELRAYRPGQEDRTTPLEGRVTGQSAASGE